MKYIAVLDSDDKLSKEAIEAVKNTVFCGDDQVPYCFDIDSVEEVTDQTRKKGKWIPPKHDDDVLQHLLELSSTLDKYSAGKNYMELRKAHYKNIEWIQNHGLTDMYYDVLFGQIKEERENGE